MKMKMKMKMAEGNWDPMESNSFVDGVRAGLTRRELAGALAMLASAISTGGCAQSGASTQGASASTTAPLHGIVAAGAKPAADAGAAILSAGGNAVDAIVATAIAMAVVDPSNTSIMGRTHLLVLNASGECDAIDGRSMVPAAWHAGDKATGRAGVVPVGGNPRSFEHALQRFGRLTMEQVCAPAIRLARDGFEVPSNLARVWSRRVPVLQRNPVAAKLFLKEGGLPYREGEVFRQPELAASLSLYAKGGADRFLNQALTRDLALLQAAGSKLTTEDFLAYRPIDAEYIHTRYRGWDVWTIGRQGYGFLVAQTLELLQAYDLRLMSAADRWATMLVAQQVAFKGQRDEALGSNASSLLDRNRIQMLAQRVRAILQSSNASGLFEVPPTKPGIPQDTTHISVVDAQGMVASMTESIGPHFGTGFASPNGYLFAHSYQMASGQPDPDGRDVTSMLPTILRSPDGTLVALGAAGADKIRGAVLRAIVNTVDLGMTAQQAVAEPACVIHNGYVQASRELDPSVRMHLQRIGVTPRMVGRSDGDHFGVLHVAKRHADGSFSGGADTYWDGGTALV